MFHFRWGYMLEYVLLRCNICFVIIDALAVIRTVVQVCERKDSPLLYRKCHLCSNTLHARTCKCSCVYLCLECLCLYTFVKFLCVFQHTCSAFFSLSVNVDNCHLILIFLLTYVIFYFFLIVKTPFKFNLDSYKYPIIF